MWIIWIEKWDVIVKANDLSSSRIKEEIISRDYFWKKNLHIFEIFQSGSYLLLSRIVTEDLFGLQISLASQSRDKACTMISSYKGHFEIHGQFSMKFFMEYSNWIFNSNWIIDETWILKANIWSRLKKRCGDPTGPTSPKDGEVGATSRSRRQQKKLTASTRLKEGQTPTP